MKSFTDYLTEARVRPDEIVKYAVEGNRAHNESYKWGLSNPVDTPDDFAKNSGAMHKTNFGWRASQASAEYGLRAIKSGQRDIDKISHAIHKGWASVATSFDDPIYKDKPEKKAARMALVDQVKKHGWHSLPEEEKDKDRVLAYAYLKKYARENVDDIMDRHMGTNFPFG